MTDRQSAVSSSSAHASEDLRNTLLEVDISNVESVIFHISERYSFQIRTDNVKRLASYIAEKLGKTKFEAEELRNPFEYLKLHVATDLSVAEKEQIETQIEGFVKHGGTVEIVRSKRMWTYVAPLPKGSQETQAAKQFFRNILEIWLGMLRYSFQTMAHHLATGFDQLSPYAICLLLFPAFTLSLHGELFDAFGLLAFIWGATLVIAVSVFLF